MVKVLTSRKSILPYGMLLSSIFEKFDIDLDSESNVRIPKKIDPFSKCSL